MTTTPHQRLAELIEFTQQTAQLRSPVVTDAARYGQFLLHEQELASLPGVHFDTATDDEETWLAWERLRPVQAPRPTDRLLQPWLDLSDDPQKRPALRTGIAAAVVSLEGVVAGKKLRPSDLVSLDSYSERVAVEQAFRDFVATSWEPWSLTETPRRASINTYSKLFTLRQELEGLIVDDRLELVWGIGIVSWLLPTEPRPTRIMHPLVTKPVEVSLNPSTMAIAVRPRQQEPQLETHLFSALDIPGLAVLERLSNDFFRNNPVSFSPFDRTTFEPLLKAAATHLDPGGIYWPFGALPGDRQVPPPTSECRITDTWVLLARPRSANVFVQDLERFNAKLRSDDSLKLPAAVAALVADPSQEHVSLDLPAFRGISAVYGSSAGDGTTPPQDLYFPKPYNDEQAQIVQLLEVADGVTVQGPPGTGKTHTIANVICHYLAAGKRVLVTSTKEPALAVLQDKLPPDIRSLTISLLASEREGMKQFEHAVARIASEIQRLNRPALDREINQLHQAVDAAHARLAALDRAMSDHAHSLLSPIDLDGELLDPLDAAHEIAASRAQVELLQDALLPAPQFRPLFTDAAIANLRQARRALGKDLSYLGAKLPQLTSLPTPLDLMQVHQDLVEAQRIAAEVEAGRIPRLVDSSLETYLALDRLLSDVLLIRNTWEELERQSQPWHQLVASSLRRDQDPPLRRALELLGQALDTHMTARQTYLERPLFAPAEIDLDPHMLEALARLARGEAPFGLASRLGKGKEKALLVNVRILNAPPRSPDDWSYVLRFCEHRQAAHDLLVRWNALAPEFNLPLATDAAAAHSLWRTFSSLAMLVGLEGKTLATAKALFPTWQISGAALTELARLSEFESYLRQHALHYQLGRRRAAIRRDVDATLAGCTGPITLSLRRFISEDVGLPALSTAQIEQAWNALLLELRRLHGLRGYLDTVLSVTASIADCGAPLWADALRGQPLVWPHDDLLPDNWRTLWRLRRLLNHLNQVEATKRLSELGKQRRSTEVTLARDYSELVSNLTWLRLAENATPDVRAALMSYLTAIARIGKGTGVRAARYRQDARSAAVKANQAVPCWIMPHYRVSESLAPEFGAFDLVIIDEASQSDLSALPAILRARKLLVVGDHKQVSPEAVGLQEAQILNLRERFLQNQVPAYSPQMTPDRSVYDLARVCFAASSVMLKEHFRSVPAIIEYSKREHYNHELIPLRIPRRSERLDPPLIDVLIEDGFRAGDVNAPEAAFIVAEIKQLIAAPATSGRSIGVVSLLGPDQAKYIWEQLEHVIGPDEIERHQIRCGDARTFQGDERDIMFLSMVAEPGAHGLGERDLFAQRFNVAASRARNRMYLVRSLRPEDLSERDPLRSGLLRHFYSPFAQSDAPLYSPRDLCATDFERALYDLLTERGYRVTPQVRTGGRPIDLVVEGSHDTRLAVECDGDKQHRPDSWEDAMRRQRVLERAGWQFWRCFASTFVLRRTAVLDDLESVLREHGIAPTGPDSSPNSQVEHRTYRAAST